MNHKKYTTEELEKCMFGAFFQLFDGTYGDIAYYKENYVKDKHAEKLKAAFSDLIQRKYITIEKYDEQTNGVEMKNADAMYEYLSMVNDYLFFDGTQPNLSDFTL